MRLMADLAAFWHFISGKLASVDGPYRDKRGRIVYRLFVGGEHRRWFRSYAKAKQLAERHNAKMQAAAERQGTALVDALIVERESRKDRQPESR